MVKTITALGVAIVLLVSAREFFAERYRAEYPRHETAVSPAYDKGIPLDDVTAVSLLLPGTNFELIYLKDKDAWRLPAYRNAYARADRIDSVVRGIMESVGVTADTRGRDDSFYGISDDSLRIKIYAGKDTPAADVLCGRQLPGLWGRDSYVRPVGSNDVYHIDGNPAAAVGAPSNLPPMVDSNLIPSALGVLGEPAKIVFQPEGVAPFSHMERRKREPTEEELKNMPPAMRDMDHYDWYAVSPDGEKKLNEHSASAFVSFVRGLEYDRIPDDDEMETIIPAEGIRLVITFERKSQGMEEESAPEFSKEYYELRGTLRDKSSLVYFSGTGLMTAVSAKKAELMIPTMDILMKALTSPSVYDKAR